MLSRAKDSFNLFPDSFQICPGGQSSHWTLLQWWWLSRSYCDHGGPSSFGEFEINPTCRCDLKCFWWNLGFFYLHVCQGRQHKGQVFWQDQIERCFFLASACNQLMIMSNHSICWDVVGLHEPAPRWIQGHIVNYCDMFMLQTSVQELLGEDTTPNELTMDRLLKTPARLGVGFPGFQAKFSQRPNWFVGFTSLHFLVQIHCRFIFSFHFGDSLVLFPWCVAWKWMRAWGCGHYKHYFLAVAQCNLTVALLAGSMDS